MAKLTLTDGTIFEGTTEEIFAIAERFNGVKADEPALKAEPLKVGDYAKVVGTKKVECYVAHRFDIGEIVRVEKLGFSEGSIKGREIDGNDYDFFHPTNLVKATDEEVEEAKRKVDEATAKARKEAVFTQVGRKPNEYRKGDIVRYIGSASTNGMLVEVIEDTNAWGTTRIIYHDNIGLGKCAEYSNSIEPITFVESRLDRTDN